MKLGVRNAINVILSIILLFSLTTCHKQVNTQVPETPGLAVTNTSEPAKQPESSMSPRPSDDIGTYSPELPSPGPESEPVRVPVKSVTIELSSKEVTRGKTLKPTVTILPDDATDRSYTLHSSNNDVLRLIDGQWTAVGAGTAELLAVAENDITGSVAVTVTVPAESLNIGAKEITLNRGDSITLIPVIAPVDSTDQNIRYSSGNESIASISEDGTISGVSAGSAIIEGIAGNVSDRITVTVIVPVDTLKINTDKRAYCVGEQGSYTVQIGPQDATDKTYTVTVSGDAVETTGDNIFSCVAGGEATFTVTTPNGFKERQVITVVDLVAFADEVFRLTNIERENTGLLPLSGLSALTQTAIVRANETLKSFSHTRPDGRSCFTAFDENGVDYGWAGENIAMGQKTPAEVVRAWMESEGHRENIINKEFRHLGVGVAMDKNGKLYWSQNFTD